MPVNTPAYKALVEQLRPRNVTLVAVSKLKPVSDIEALYALGQRDFGENYVQELAGKKAALPPDIRWHFIGHLQSNKVKFIAPFVHLIHGIDSIRLLKEVDKQGAKAARVIDVLLQVHIAQEETKFGFDEEELDALFQELSAHPTGNVRVTGFMGMASFSDQPDIVRGEFANLQALFEKYKAHRSFSVDLQVLSMGMSNDYPLALENGSNMVRIGSLLFGRRVEI